ncbi:MAG: NUDIX hydrolase [Luteolibacter sp.]
MSDPELLYSTRWLALYRIGHWDYVRRPQTDTCVGILAITPEEEIILVEQFRIPLQRRAIEIPAGLVGDEPEFAGETIAETARRELLEETGYHAETMKLLAISPTSSGMTSEFIHLFHASGLTRQHDGGGTHTEDIRVHRVPLRTLRSWLTERETEGMAVDFKIHAALSLAGISI